MQSSVSVEKAEAGRGDLITAVAGIVYGTGRADITSFKYPNSDDGTGNGMVLQSFFFNPTYSTINVPLPKGHIKKIAMVAVSHGSSDEAKTMKRAFLRQFLKTAIVEENAPDTNVEEELAEVDRLSDDQLKERFDFELSADRSSTSDCPLSDWANTLLVNYLTAFIGLKDDSFVLQPEDYESECESESEDESESESECAVNYKWRGWC
eukprot:544852_1